MKQLDSFSSCKDAHNKSFMDIQKALVEMESRINLNIDSIADKITMLDKRITRVEVKSGIWGAIAGFIPFLAYYFSKNH